ncbi:30S ribosomal protein S5 [bacterium]|nr:30S ribosomal protein S5 [bacterium]
MERYREKRENRGYDRKVVSIRRVAKVRAGGKNMRFSVMIVAGDRKGRVGVSMGKGLDTRSASEKAERRASTSMRKIELIGDTIPHEILHKTGAAKILLRPAKPGTGIVAGAAGRNVLEMAGIENVYCKQLGSSDIIANTYCVYEALLLLRKGRVLERMGKMRERIGIKEKIDQERMKKAAKKKTEKREFKVRSRRDATRKNTKKK